MDQNIQDIKNIKDKFLSKIKNNGNMEASFKDISFEELNIHAPEKVKDSKCAGTCHCPLKNYEVETKRKEDLFEPIKVIGVRFKKAGKIHYYDPKEEILEKNDGVIVETIRGIEYGNVEIGNHYVEKNDIEEPFREIIQVATDEDREQVKRNQEKADASYDITREKIAEHNLDMKLIDIEMTFDASKIIFYFTADGRVDFRELVKDLAYIFKIRIELRQIGVRDEAKMMNGIGICGRQLCCASFLDDFEPVSIRMAKEQGLSLNPSKISGVCGRLMCCLQYEEDNYKYFHAKLPDIGEKVETADGIGEILSLNILREQVRVAIRENPDDPPFINLYHVDDIKVIGRRKNHYHNENKDEN